LNVSSVALSVIGDNIANVNTIGFKKSRAHFSDQFPMSVSYVHGPVQLGTGAFVGSTTQDFGQGALALSNNNLDMAISGNGFFAVRDDGAIYYTRNGEFYLDGDGYLVNSSGLHVQGYLADDGDILPNLGDLQVPVSDIKHKDSTEITITANLDSESDDSSQPLSALTLDGTSAASDLNDVASDADFSTSVTIYDSLGNSHDVLLCFEKEAASNTWTCYAMVDAAGLEDTAGVYEDGKAFTIATIDLEFDTDGTLLTFNQSNTSALVSWNFDGAAAGDFDVNLGLDSAGDEADGQITQLASDSTVTSVDQDGYAVGHLTSVEVTTDGIIHGVYDNGQDLALGQVAVGIFDSPHGLEKTGNNLYRSTRMPGEPSFGVAGEGGRGDIFGAALEASNVDIEEEFVNMITSQRSYQANSRVLSATSDLLRELVNLV
jgi:flagellar hook protein FlgE